MKFLKYILLTATALTLFSCTDTKLYEIRGTLYSDSTLTVPLPGQQLFFTMDGFDTLGSVSTDSQGRFGFAYNIGVGNLVDNSKFQFEYNRLYILYKGDTLYGGEYPCIRDTLNLYPGSWKGWWHYGM